MLAIRMQRVGRKGHPEYRVVVQDARLTPSSGRIVARVGHYDPHSKTTTIDKEKIEFYLGNGAQPSERVVKILLDQKIQLPEWVTKPSGEKKRSIRNPEKLRKNQPEEPKEEQPEAEATSEPAPAVEPEAATEDTEEKSE